MTEHQIDWQGVRDEATEILRNYIRINTTNPPGNEMEAARYLEGIVHKEGIEATVYEPAPPGQSHGCHPRENARKSTYPPQSHGRRAC